MNRFFRPLSLLCSLVFLSSLGFQSSSFGDGSFNEKDPLLVESHLEPSDLGLGQSGRLVLKVKLPKTFHAYAEQFKLSIANFEGFLVGTPTINPLKTWYDKFSKRERSGVEVEATLVFPIEAPHQIILNEQFPGRDAAQPNSIDFVLTYQACTDTFCLFPTPKSLSVSWNPQHVNSGGITGDITLDAHLSGPSISAPPSDSRTSEESTFSLEGFKKALYSSRPLAFFLAFLAGLLTSFTPCIFPMIPITLAILGSGAERRSRKKNFLLSLTYVHGIAVTYALLGLIAVKTGSLFGSTLGNPWIVGGLCLLMLLMALSMMGLFELQMPAPIRNRFGSGPGKAGYLGAFISGLFAGVVASPCVGPILVSILAFVSTQGSYLLGFFLLFTYAMGMGLLFLLLGAFSELTRKLPRSGPWMENIKIFFAMLMMGAFYYYLQFVLVDRWWNLALGLGLVLLSSYYGAFNSVARAGHWKKVRKGFCLATFALGVLFAAEGALPGALPWGAVIYGPHGAGSSPSGNPNLNQEGLPWQDYSDSELIKARTQGLPVLIDFWAEWCVACHELEEKTFTDPHVRSLASQFVLLKMDATKDSPLLRQLKTRYRIQGLPSIVFIHTDGVWLNRLTLTEFEKPNRFGLRLKQALKGLNTKP